MNNTQEIRAQYDADTITVYQAYGKAIALPATKVNQFAPPFSFQRMTWIKPSYLWLMERSNWATKPQQEFILGIKIKRAYWEYALSLGVLTHPDLAIYTDGLDWEQKFSQAKVHIQWDPERTLRGAKLQVRSIQVGISRHLIEQYNNEWIVAIDDLTPLTRKISQLKKQGKYKEAKQLLPKEQVYVLPDELQKRIGVR
ncbi:DUF4291 domain-containing protein [Microscilla marina]|uniref:DUF4291 domain-containing protein n=1 Tax=Microscilla marina ATCC 23134 TaxID=313606 RepID=A1ZSV6_MICM2|nr:DUF4291 domain-containing protein [Microscilla marina]EAY26520.1 hypothetical protein M23134_01690 [Microscilla marina ATCC 23134]